MAATFPSLGKPISVRSIHRTSVSGVNDRDAEHRASSPRSSTTQRCDGPGRFYTAKRLQSNCTADPLHPVRRGDASKWRARERSKTASVALILCLNIGVDPPDVIRPSPRAKLECWIDPDSLPPARALQQIGRNLQQQYEMWQPRARYKLSLDTSIDDIKKICCSLRRTAKEDRILFHYNGHGVPRPSPSGEIWVFNKDFTQYIPVSVYDLQSWLGSPCIYVYDCSAAGYILHAFNRIAVQRDAEAARFALQQQASHFNSPHSSSILSQDAVGCPSDKVRAHGAPYPSYPSTGRPPLRDSIQLAACRPGETLPLDPDLPYDVFTSCLTTPIDIALRFFVLQNSYVRQTIDLDMVARIPGRLHDRRTPLGELNWIFTAITDTIAWNVFPKDLFKRLFRQDVIVAALFRNFLLAGRIMRAYSCIPMSSPSLPDTHHHRMWASWDFSVDLVLGQLPALLKAKEEGDAAVAAVYRHSDFFAEQLTAFEVWLSQAKVSNRSPEQLPIVLQVLLSQVHRHRALILLTRFLDLGGWAVQQALAVGIFPYVLKLLQSPAPELKPILVFIWARILAYDQQCQSDLIKDNGFLYFVHIMTPETKLPSISNLSEHRAMCAFVLSTFCHHFRHGQSLCLKHNVLSYCLEYMGDPNATLRKWVCICMSKVMEGYQDACNTAMQLGFHRNAVPLLEDSCAEVRAAAILLLGTAFSDSQDQTDLSATTQKEIAVDLLGSAGDASPAVRKELLVALSRFIATRVASFLDVAGEFDQISTSQRQTTLDERNMRRALQRMGYGSMVVGKSLESQTFNTIWKVVLSYSLDPHPQVWRRACVVVDSIMVRVLHSPTSLQRSHERVSTNESMDRSAKQPSCHRNTEIIGQAVAMIPLLSSLMEWARECFAEPQIQPREDDESGSSVMLARDWRLARNEAVSRGARLTREGAADRRWDFQTLKLEGAAQSKVMRFHTFENHVVGVDSKSMVRTWDRTNGSLLQAFHSRAHSPSNATSLLFINEDDVSLLLVGSDDGCLRLFRHYAEVHTCANESRGPPELVTCWRPLSDVFTFGFQAPLMTEWLRHSGRLVVAGNARIVRVFDAETEQTAVEIDTKSNHPVTSMTSDGSLGKLLVTGFRDGSIRLYDARQGGQDALTANIKPSHGSKVLGVRVQYDEYRLITASTTGEVLVKDLRNLKNVDVNRTAMHQDTSHFQAHDNLPLFALGSSHVKVHNFLSNRTLATLQPPATTAAGTATSAASQIASLSGTKHRVVQSCCFHPILPLLAVTWPDGTRLLSPRHIHNLDGLDADSVATLYYGRGRSLSSSSMIVTGTSA